MNFLTAYAKYGPDTIAISEALDIKEHEADALINAKMNRDRLGPRHHQQKALDAPRKPIRFAGYDETERTRW